MDQTQAIEMRRDAANELLDSVMAHEYTLEHTLHIAFPVVSNDVSWWLLVSKLEKENE